VTPSGRLIIGAHSEVAGSEPQLQAEQFIMRAKFNLTAL